MSMKPVGLLLVSLSFFAVRGRPAEPPSSRMADHSAGVLPARWHPSGFGLGDDSYNAVYAASDGKIYYVICAHKIDTGAQMYCFNPADQQVRHLGDLTEVAGEKGLKAVPQGKSHVPFFEHNGKLYFATHLGYYNTEGGKEMAGVPPPGYKPYPGGHFLSYEMKTSKFERLASAPPGEGILSMTMDPKRDRLYGLTWPSACFLSYDLARRALKNWGLVSEEGERGSGSTFRVVCRSLAQNPLTGSVYFTLSTGDILQYDYGRDVLGKLAACTMRRDIFGLLDPNKPGHMGYNWRQTLWRAGEDVFYGVHGHTGFLFRFDPRSEQIVVLDRIAAGKTRDGGFFDSFPYGYLGLSLGPDGETLYYLTGTPAGEEIRLITYHIPTQSCTDQGAIALEDGRRPVWAQAIAVGRDKRIYTVSKIKEGEKLRVDLLSFPDPLQTQAPPEPRYRLVRSWTNPARMPNPLQESHACCLDKDGNIIIVDSVGSRVQRFTPEGKWLDEIGSGPGSGPGQFSGPRDAKVNRAGEIYVSDGNNCRIQVFSHEGKYLRMFGQKGTGSNQFLRAHALDFGPDGRLYVVDVDNNRVSVYDPSDKFLFAFGEKGVRTGEFRDAHGLGVDAKGHVYVSNYYGPVQTFTGDGKFLFEFAPAGFRGWTHFHSMGVDRQGNTYLAARDAHQRNAVVKDDHRGADVTAWSVQGSTGELGVKSATISPEGLVYVPVDTRTLHGIFVYGQD